MRGSAQKFFADVGGPDHGGQLMWPGTADGFPFRGPVVPDLRGDEYDNSVALILDYHSRSFRLWDPADKKLFDSIMDRIVNGWYRQHKRDDHWIAEHNSLLVWLEWVQIYGETPNSRHPGVSNATNPIAHPLGLPHLSPQTIGLGSTPHAAEPAGW